MPDELIAKLVTDDSAAGQAGQNGGAVKVGDIITYKITYANSEADPANVVITDILDAGLDFLEATNSGSHNTATHTVSWVVIDVPAASAGSVTLKVVVNAVAAVRVRNSASVQVGGNVQVTNIVVNSLAPVKEVSDVNGAGVAAAVSIGDRITYEIIYVNSGTTAAKVVITDHLDAGVNFDAASNYGDYNPDTHTVTWTLPDVPDNSTGMAILEVSVNTSALVEVENSASVQVGTNASQDSNTVVLPLAAVIKVSDDSEAGVDGSKVQAWDRITYEISYLNYSGAEATVVVTNKLPAGVVFESADNGGVYNAGTHTVTWTLPNVASAAKGMVSVVVFVDENAGIRIENSATVEVGANAPLVTNVVVNPVKSRTKACVNQNTKCRKIIKGRKIWVDNENAGDTRPPFVEIALLRDWEIYQSVRISSTGNGAFSFGCLPIWKNSKQKYNYQIDEATVVDNYTKTIDGYNVTNTLTTT